MASYAIEGPMNAGAVKLVRKMNAERDAGGK